MHLTPHTGDLAYNPRNTMLRHCVIIFIGVLGGLLVHYYLFNSIGLEFSELKTGGLLASIGIWILLTYLMYLITIVIEKLFELTNQIGLRLLIAIFLSSVITFFTISLFYKYTSHISVAPETDLETITGSYAKIAVVTAIISIIYNVILFAIYTFQVYTEDQINYVARQRKEIDMRFMALRSQLSPHFLFNGLNTISALIYSNKEKAELYIRDLYTTYQYALTQFNKETVTLRDELQLVNTYLGMVNIRFGDCIRLSNQIDKSQHDIQVVPFSLQTLIENALKYNIADEENPLEVDLSIQDAYIAVSNRKQLKEVHHSSSTGVGHDNLSQRYKLLGTRDIKINDTDHTYTVSIPYLK